MGPQQGLWCRTRAPSPPPDLLEEDKQEESGNDEDEDAGGEAKAQVLHGGQGWLRVQQQPPPRQPQHEGSRRLGAAAEAAGGHHAAHREDGRVGCARHLHGHRAPQGLVGTCRGTAAFLLLLLPGQQLGATRGPQGRCRSTATQGQLRHQRHHPAEGAADEGDGGGSAHQLAQAALAEGMVAGQQLGRPGPPGTPVRLVADPALPAGLRPRSHGAPRQWTWPHLLLKAGGG